MIRKVILGIVIVAALVVGALLAWHFLKGQEPVGGEKVGLRLAWIPGATFAGDYIALQNGYWKEAGLGVSIHPGGFEHDAIKLVASGADTFGISSGPQILQARANGVPIVAIGAVIPQSPIGWVSKKNSGITKPQDFPGKKIGAQFGTHTEITLEALCGKLGIALDSFKRIPVKFDPRPFVVGDVDVLPVYIVDQPVDLERQGIALNIIDPGDYGMALAYGNVYFTTDKTIRTKPELVKRFLAGATRGWIFVNSNPDAAATALCKNAPELQKDAILAKTKAVLRFVMKGRTEYRGVFPTEQADWERTRDILTKYGNLPQSVSIRDSYTNAYLP